MRVRKMGRRPVFRDPCHVWNRKGRSGTPAPRVSSLVGGERSTGVPGRSSRGAAVGGRTVRLDPSARAVSLLSCRLGSRSLGAGVTLECAAFEATARPLAAVSAFPCHCSSDYLYLMTFILLDRRGGGISINQSISRKTFCRLTQSVAPSHEARESDRSASL